MASAPELDTSTTLIRLLSESPPNQLAWNQFVARYGPLIYRWCRKWGSQQVDAEDVTQNVLLELARQMRSFAYDRKQSFRGWLHVVAYRCWCRFVKLRIRSTAERKDVPLDGLISPEAGAHFLQLLEQESDNELLEIAAGRVRSRVATHTWEAFRLTASENLPAAEVADRLGMRVGTVFVARSKVQKMLREEIQKLTGDTHI